MENPTRTALAIMELAGIVSNCRWPWSSDVAELPEPKRPSAESQRGFGREVRATARHSPREIPVMDGSTAAGNITAAVEFNIYRDPEAALGRVQLLIPVMRSPPREVPLDGFKGMSQQPKIVAIEE